MTAPFRPTPPDALGMAEPLRPEIAEALEIFERRAIDAALDRIRPDRLPAVLAEALVARHGRAKAERLLRLAADRARESL